MTKEHIGYIIAILSVIASGIISWYFYDKSQQYRVPAYSIDSFPTPVFRTNKASSFPFKVIKNDGTPITKNINLATHYLWNKGEKPILEQDTLDSVKVAISGDDVEILNVSVSKYSRPVINCSAQINNKNVITISYKILEQGDGCAIDILYVGDSDLKFDVSGTIIGVDQFEIFSQTVDEYFENLPWYMPYKRYLPGFFVIIPFAIFLIIYLKKRDAPKHKFWTDAIVYILFVSQIYFLAELRFGSEGYFISNERPNIGSWVSDKSANKANSPDAPKARAGD